ncbi:hypothetical protein KIH27_04705 [Mycobacterium sp. M1]|uniref:Uncharacterized protein n=1 Tax=Mycolicibacter acidiphilus TaxID=2835306 RepID=A0ABS5RFW5_9MYCO|nr:hypothetical protein [Mycolicibacter acidiphilus]MBS9532887.1 hypothetical protein [Mycolicibacter acidiphilus]
MSMNILTVHNTPRSVIRSALRAAGATTAAGLIGLGVGLAAAPSAFADEVPVPAPVPAPPAVPAPGAAAALPGGGNQVGNAFLQVLGSMLGRVAPGAEQMIPSTMPDPGAAVPAPAAPAAPAPAPAGQTVT